MVPLSLFSLEIILLHLGQQSARSFTGEGDKCQMERQLNLAVKREWVSDCQEFPPFLIHVHCVSLVHCPL